MRAIDIKLNESSAKAAIPNPVTQLSKYWALLLIKEFGQPENKAAMPRTLPQILKSQFITRSKTGIKISLSNYNWNTSKLDLKLLWLPEIKKNPSIYGAKYHKLVNKLFSKKYNGKYITDDKHDDDENELKDVFTKALFSAIKMMDPNATIKNFLESDGYIIVESNKFNRNLDTPHAQLLKKVEKINADISSNDNNQPTIDLDQYRKQFQMTNKEFLDFVFKFRSKLFGHYFLTSLHRWLNGKIK